MRREGEGKRGRRGERGRKIPPLLGTEKCFIIEVSFVSLPSNSILLDSGDADQIQD